MTGVTQNNKNKVSGFRSVLPSDISSPVTNDVGEHRHADISLCVTQHNPSFVHGFMYSVHAYFELFCTMLTDLYFDYFENFK